MWASHISSSLTFVLNVYLHSPCRQGSTDDIGRLFSVKYWFQHNPATWNIRIQSHYHVMPFNTLSCINYTKTKQRTCTNTAQQARLAIFALWGPHYGETHARQACPQCVFTDRDHWSLHGGDLLYILTLLASSPLSNKLKMLLENTIKNGGNSFCNFYSYNRIYSRLV